MHPQSSTPEPKRLQRRPHFRGLPVPANVIIDKGIPDFAVIDHIKARELAHQRRCALCGEKIRGLVAFVGGEKSMASGFFTDGPMHKECARFAFTACPFVSGDHRHYRDPKKHAGTWIKTSNVTLATDMGILLAMDFHDLGNIYQAVGIR